MLHHTMSLSSLPVTVLQNIFNHINQHQALILAPMHSSFYQVTKIKLYRNIYVYNTLSFLLEQWFGAREDILRHRFQYHKDINNFKSNQFTIISLKTLERYMWQMDSDQFIRNFELYEGHLVLIDCILRHFHSIKYLKVILRRFFYWVENSDVDFCDAIPGYIRACKLKTIFIFNQYIRRPRRKLVQPEEERTWFYLPLGTRQSVINLASQLSNITTLLMDFDRCVNYSNVFTNMKLRKLSIKRLRMPNSFIVDEVFNTENLQELTLVVSSPLNRFFSVFELDTKYPRLFLLCLQYRKTNEKDSYANDLLNYKHKTLEMLTVCYGSPKQVPIKTMCSLSSPFPVASINLWFYWEQECQDEDSEKIIMMSPRVPHGIVGVHMLYIDQTGLDECLMSIKKDAKHEEFSTPKAYYTQWELYQIFAQCCRERKNFILPRDRLFRQYESIQKRFPLPKDYVA